MSEEICYLSINALNQAYASGALSPVETARAALDRIDAFNGLLNAYSQVDAELTLAQARESEQRWRRGAPLGYLDGVPYSVKDTLMARGYATRRGSRVTSNAPARESAPIVQHVASQGAVMLGITTTPEFGGGPVTISPLSGITRNPWNPAMTAGGSSGGAAAAVASGMGAVALATDAGGSIRTPAALNGVFGFKATGGRIPAYPGNVAGGLSSPGPITRGVADAAAVLNAAAHPDLRDPEALPDDAGDYLAGLETPSLRRLRIAYSATLGYAAEVDPQVAQAVRQAVDVLGDLGACVEQIDPPMGNPLPVYKTLLMSGFTHALSHLTPEQEAQLGPQMREIIAFGRRLTLNDYLRAQDERRALANRMARFHAAYDLIVTPSVAVPAFPAERWEPEHFEKYQEPRAWVPFGYPFNLTQQPAASIPCGLTQEGLPIGLQIAAWRFEERLVLRAARAYEIAARPVGRPRLDTRANASS